MLVVMTVEATQVLPLGFHASAAGRDYSHPPVLHLNPNSRLDETDNGYRRQGMRMGNTFSRALDPKKPLLFGDFPLDILEEEVWHPSVRRLAWQDPLTGLTADLTPEQTSATAAASPASSIDRQTAGKLAT